MRRVLCALCLIVVPAYLVGCSSDTSGNAPAKSTADAQKEAAKMPPPPGVKTGSPKK